MYGFYTFYTILVFVVSIISSFSISSQRRTKKCYIILCCLLFIIAACRGINVGGDLINYLPHFKEVCKTNFDNLFLIDRGGNFEPGYVIMLKIISLFSNSERWFLVVTSFISLLGPFYFIKKYSPSPCLSILMYILLGFYTNTFNNVRQSIALSIIFFSISFILNRQFVKFCFIVILATLFHYSAIFYLLVYPFSKFEIRTKEYCLIILIGCSLVLILGLSVIDLLRAYIFLKYSEGNLVTNGGYNLFFLYLFISFISFIYYRKSLKNNVNLPLFNLLVLLMVFSSIYQLSGTIMVNLARITSYYFTPVIVLFPMILKTYHLKSNNQILTMCLLILLFLYMVNYIMGYNPVHNSNSQVVIPYVFLS